VVCIYNPSYLEGRLGELQLDASTCKKKKTGMVIHICNLKYVRGIGRKLRCETGPDKNVRPYMKKFLRPKELGTWLQW
jgi:hypothetical protein